MVRGKEVVIVTVGLLAGYHITHTHSTLVRTSTELNDGVESTETIEVNSDPEPEPVQSPELTSDSESVESSTGVTDELEPVQSEWDDLTDELVAELTSESEPAKEAAAPIVPLWGEPIIAPAGTEVILGSNRTSYLFAISATYPVLMIGNGNRCEVVADNGSPKMEVKGNNNVIETTGPCDEVDINGYKNKLTIGTYGGVIKIFGDEADLTIEENCENLILCGNKTTVDIRGNLGSMTLSGTENTIKVGGSCLGEIQVGFSKEQMNEHGIWYATYFNENGKLCYTCANTKVSGHPLPPLKDVNTERSDNLDMNMNLENATLYYNPELAFASNSNNIEIGGCVTKLKILTPHSQNILKCDQTIEHIEIRGDKNKITCPNYFKLVDAGFENSVIVSEWPGSWH